jgi:hypothetical protein
MRQLTLDDLLIEQNEMDPAMITIARSTIYTQPVIVENWTLPAGAFGESCGPI